MDHSASLYIQIGHALQRLTSETHYALIKEIEHIFDSESQTELGTFLNDIVGIYFTHLFDPDLDIYLFDAISSTDLQEDLIFTVGQTVLCLTGEKNH